MGRNVEVEIIAKLRSDSPGVLASFPLSLKEEDVVFKDRIDRRSSFREYTDVKALPHEVRVVVDVDIPGFPALLKPVEVDARPVVLTDVVPYHHITVSPLHDAAEPQIVVAVVVLDIGIDAVVVSIKAAAVPPSFSHIPVGFVVLDSNPVSMKAKDTVSCVVSTTMGQRIVFVYGVLAAAGYDAVASGVLYVIAPYVHLGPQIV